MIDFRLLQIPSLTPPPFPKVTYEEYFAPDAGDYIHLGRARKLKESAYNFSAQLWMTTDDINSGLSEEALPDLETIMPLLDLLGFGSNTHMHQLKEVMGAALPEGFPVKIGTSHSLRLETFADGPFCRASDPLRAQGHCHVPQL